MKPLCPTCGDRHESYQAHVFHVVNSVANKSHVVNVLETVLETRVVRQDEPMVVEVVRNPDRHRDKESRRAYMREYMRKRRARLPG